MVSDLLIVILLVLKKKMQRCKSSSINFTFIVRSAPPVTFKSSNTQPSPASTTHTAKLKGLDILHTRGHLFKGSEVSDLIYSQNSRLLRDGNDAVADTRIPPNGLEATIVTLRLPSVNSIVYVKGCKYCANWR